MVSLIFLYGKHTCVVVCAGKNRTMMLTSNDVKLSEKLQMKVCVCVCVTVNASLRRDLLDRKMLQKRAEEGLIVEPQS